MLDSPRLECGPIRLVPFGTEHLTQTYVDWLNDAEVMRYSEQRHRHHDLQSCEAFVRCFENTENLLWAIEATDQDNSHVGNITASIDPNNGIADIGLLIGTRNNQGRGYGISAWSAVLEYLKTRPNLRKITGGCMAPNQAMVRIMRRAGMREDGIRKAHFIVDSAPVDVLYYAVWIG